MEKDEVSAIKSGGDSKRNPISKYSVTCPMCNQTNYQFRLNARMFWNEDTDVDLQPRNFHTLKGLENYHPPLYEMWHCPNCQYTSSYKSFSEPLKDIHINSDIITRKIKESIDSDEKTRRIIVALGNGATFESTDFFQSIRLTLLGIYFDQLIVTLLKQNFIAVGKLYLRLAWLYRDMAKLDPRAAETRQKLDALLATLQPDWPDAAADEAHALDKALFFYQEALSDRTTVKSAVDSATVQQLMGRILIKRAQYRQAQESLLTSMNTANQARADIEQQLRTSGKGTPQLSPEESGELLSQSRKLESLINESQNLMSDIREAVLAEQTQLATQLLAQNPGKAPDELRAILSANKIDGRVAAKLLPEEKKKGLFGFLR